MREIQLLSGKARILPATYRTLISAQKRAKFEGEAIMLLIPDILRFVLSDETLYAPTPDDVERLPFEDIITLEDALLRGEQYRPHYDFSDPTTATLASGLRVKIQPVLASDMMAARRLAQNPLETSVYMIERTVLFEQEGTFESRIYEDILDNCSLEDGLGLQSILFDRDEKKTQALKSKLPPVPWQSATNTSPDSSTTATRTAKSKA